MTDKFDFNNFSSNPNPDNNNQEYKNKVDLEKVKEKGKVYLDKTIEIFGIICSYILKYGKIFLSKTLPILNKYFNKLANYFKKKNKDKAIYLKFKTINKLYNDLIASDKDTLKAIKEFKESKKSSNTNTNAKNEDKEKLSLGTKIFIVLIALFILKFLIFDVFFANLMFVFLLVVALSPLILVIKDVLSISHYKEKLEDVELIRPDVVLVFKKLALKINDDELSKFLDYYQMQVQVLQTFLNVNLDARQIFLEGDLKNELMLGFSSVLTNQDSKIKAEKLDDEMMHKFSIAPQANFLVRNGGIHVFLDNWITDFLNVERAVDLKEYIEIMGYSRFFKANETAEEVDLSKFSKKGKQIISRLRQDDVKEKLGMYVHNQFAEGITENKYFIKIKMVLQNTNKAKAKSLLNEVGLITGITPTIVDGENDKTIYLKFKYKVTVKSKEFKFKDILEQAEKGVINIGATDSGDYIVKYPREDDPSFTNVGGISRSGKSTFNTRFVTTALYLKDENGFYDYQDVFIGSVKAFDDYYPLKWSEKGMFITDNPIEIYKMLIEIDKVCQNRSEVFRKNGCTNIKQYNKKFKNEKMGKILLIMDEYRNTLDAAERLGKIEINGIKINNLSDEIQKLYSSMNSLHGSRGYNTVCITQAFNKGQTGLGMVADTLDSRILGYANATVWNTQDKTETVSKYLKDKEGLRKGLFMINAPSFQQANTDEVEVDKIGGFVETRTHFIDTQEIANNFDRYFETENQYGALIRDNFETDATNLDKIISNNQSEGVLENQVESEGIKEEDDFNFDDFNL